MQNFFQIFISGVGSIWIKNAWYVAGWSSDIKSDELLSRTFLNIPIILYRDSSENVVAMEDRCSHRFAPLSKGRLEGDSIRCMYHGLKFSAAGDCIEIPGGDKIPPGMKVKTFPVTERQKLVWIWLGDPTLANEREITDLPYLDSPYWAYKEGYIHYESDFRLIADNLLDFSHLTFVHEKTIGSSGLANERPKSEIQDYGIRLINFNKNDDPAPHVKKFGGLNGKVDRWTISDWYYRGNLLVMDSGSMPAGSDGPDGDRAGAIEFRHLSALTPETDLTCHYHFAQAQSFATDNDDVTEGIFKTVCIAFEEDRDIIEAQQRVINLDPMRDMKPVSFDGPLTHIRKIMNKAIEQEQSIAK